MAETSVSQLQNWIERMNAGDPSARDAVIAHTAERLRQLTRKIFLDYKRLRTFEESSDVLQIAVMRLMRTLEKTQPDDMVHFFRLAAREIRRALIDLTRHYFGPEGAGTKQEQLCDPPDHSPDFADDHSDITNEPCRLAMWSEFHQRVENMPEELRDVFELIWYEGITQEDAAQVLSLSHSTIKRRWLAARLWFQETLQNTELENLIL